MDVAQRAGVSTDTVTRAIRSGELPATREPRKVSILNRDCEAWIQSRRQPVIPVGIPRKEQGA